jgi:hypothetical protein
MERKSPLLRSLMTAVRETIKDYQDDIKHILTDRQLAAEIMYDLEQVCTCHPPLSQPRAARL